MNTTSASAIWPGAVKSERSKTMPKLIFLDTTSERIEKLRPLIGDHGVRAVLAELENSPGLYIDIDMVGASVKPALNVVGGKDS